jgi:hypothetical protein
MVASDSGVLGFPQARLLDVRRSLGPGWGERIAACVHEAGHAVIGHDLGGQVAIVQVDRSGNGGRISLIKADDPKVRTVVGSAGVAAELRYCEEVGGHPPDRPPKLSSSDDAERVKAAAQEACSGDEVAAAALVARSEIIAATMVAERWSRIERVALALFNTDDYVLRHRQFMDLMETPD